MRVPKTLSTCPHAVNEVIRVTCVVLLLVIAFVGPGEASRGLARKRNTFSTGDGVEDRVRLRLRIKQRNTSSREFAPFDRKHDRADLEVRSRPHIRRSALDGLSPLLAAGPLQGHDAAAPQQNNHTSAKEGFDPYLALCLAVKTEEASELLDWIHYHSSLGVGRFYIFDESKTSLESSLEDLIATGQVQYTQLKEPLGQLRIYSLCLEPPRREQHKFIGFIDSDEFLVLREETDLPTVLKRYEGKFGGVGVNWRLFGSSGHVTKPPGPVMRNFWKCLPAEDPQSKHIKSIVSTASVTGVGRDPHTFTYREGDFAASTRGDRIDGALSKTYVEDSLVLFHYVTKSREEFAAKMLRGSGMGNHRAWKFFEEMDSKATDNCEDLLSSAP